MAAECFHAVFEANESGPFVDVGSSDTVAANQQVQVFVVGVRHYGELGGLCVFGGVGERLGHNIIGGCRDHDLVFASSGGMVGTSVALTMSSTVILKSSG